MTYLGQTLSRQPGALVTLLLRSHVLPVGRGGQVQERDEGTSILLAG